MPPSESETTIPAPLSRAAPLIDTEDKFKPPMPPAPAQKLEPELPDPQESLRQKRPFQAVQLGRPATTIELVRR